MSQIQGLMSVNEGSSTIRVENIFKQLTEADVRQCFEVFGDIVTLDFDDEKRVADITYSDEGAALDAAESVDGCLVGDTPIHVTLAGKEVTNAAAASPDTETVGSVPDTDRTSRTLYVENLNPKLTEEDVRMCFAAFGALSHIDMPVALGGPEAARQPGARRKSIVKRLASFKLGGSSSEARNLGYAFVEYYDASAVEVAVDLADGFELGKNKLTVRRPDGSKTEQERKWLNSTVSSPNTLSESSAGNVTPVSGRGTPLRMRSQDEVKDIRLKRRMSIQILQSGIKG